MRQSEGVEKLVDGNFIEQCLVFHSKGRHYGALPWAVAESLYTEIQYSMY